MSNYNLKMSLELHQVTFSPGTEGAINVKKYIHEVAIDRIGTSSQTLAISEKLCVNQSRFNETEHEIQSVIVGVAIRFVVFWSVCYSESESTVT